MTKRYTVAEIHAAIAAERDRTDPEAAPASAALLADMLAQIGVCRWNHAPKMAAFTNRGDRQSNDDDPDDPRDLIVVKVGQPFVRKGDTMVPIYYIAIDALDDQETEFQRQ